MPPAIEDFVYSRAAHRVQSVGEYLGRIFAEQSNLLAMSEKVQGDTASEGRQARLWNPSESNSFYGGNWITSFHQGQTATEVSADVLITIPGSRSGGIFSSESADVLLCIRYLGAVGSDDVHAVDADCPEGVEANLPSFQRVSVDQLTDYEVGE
ncbi:hypothetical protein [Rathayibacter sp. VKM Ac-2857]|uniref:hypothetical protein n=1 Tax=Rathayibacter sp. VKM Ac-2857 TaxID=2739020 RepID=UPI00156465E1|nr:hypothetical protein [Rathayibacter sp. VKM Ac-2857]NQX15056.1 hypothetical protein [Rathayibacter sp. VKM Ac-2857]